MYVKSAENIPSINAIDAEWIAWYKILKSEVGKKEANVLFLKAWNKRKNEGLLGSKANTSTLRDFLASNDLEVRPDGVFAFPISVIDSVEGAISTYFGIGKWTFIILGLVILIPVSILLFNIAKNPRLLIDGMNAFSGARSGGAHA